MMLKWNEWWSVQAITMTCLLILIICTLLHYSKNVVRIAMCQSSTVPVLKGNHLWLYLTLLISTYKQSTPTCPAIALGLQYLWALCLLYGKQGLVKATLLFKSAILFYKPESVEALMSDPELIEKGSEYKLLIPWLGTGLITSGGAKWRKHRKLLTPTFHFSILENFIRVFQEQSEILVSKLELGAQEPWIDALPLISSYTLDVICETAMGISINSQSDENCKYFKAIHETGNIFMYRILRPWLYPDIIFNLTAYGRKFSTNIQIIHGLSEKMIKEKKIKMIADANSKSKPEKEHDKSAFQKRKPFLELLLEYHLKDPSFTEIDVREEVCTFMFAGHDTTAVTISWVLYCLGIYQEIQNKVLEELEGIFGREENDNISRETLTRMKYLECVIKETMRLYPTVPLILKENKHHFKVLGHTVYPGTLCCILIFGLHRDPKSFPNPEIFDPDRFLTENDKDRHPYAYIPFSAGPRNCIGQKFAMMQMKTALSSILRRFRVTSLDNREKMIIYPNIVTRCARPVRIRFESR